MADYRPKNYTPKRRSKPSSNVESEVVESILKGLWEIAKFIFGRRGSGGAQKAQVKEIRNHWEQVELYLLQENTKSLAVSEADKALDAALQLKHVSGETMGERLKAASKLFPPDLYQRVWEAHKLRNSLAHDLGAQVNLFEAQTAVGSLRAALYHLGILS